MNTTPAGSDMVDMRPPSGSEMYYSSFLPVTSGLRPLLTAALCMWCRCCVSAAGRYLVLTPGGNARGVGMASPYNIRAPPPSPRPMGRGEGGGEERNDVAAVPVPPACPQGDNTGVRPPADPSPRMEPRYAWRISASGRPNSRYMLIIL